MRTVVLRVVALALLLLLALVGVITMRTLQRLPDTLVYFVRDQGRSFTLEAVPRRSAGESVAARVTSQVAALAAGPTPTEAADGLSSAVPAGVAVRSARLDDGRLTVDLSEQFTGGGGTASMLGRLNQLYYTLSQPADVDAVVLAVAGETLYLLGGEGVMLDVPWVRAEHPELPSW